MKNRVQILFVFILLAFSSVFAQGKFGLGIILGEPTGLSAKVWTGGSNALDFAAAWSFRDNGHLLVQGDYVWHSNVFQVHPGKLPVYYGIGGRIIFSDDSRVGVRVPVGLDYQFADAPVDIFLELVPILDLVPETEFGLGGGIGVRFWFH